METEINEEAVAALVADASGFTADQLRLVIARLDRMVERGEGCKWNGKKVNVATMMEAASRLAAVLQERGEGCVYCGFGRLPKHKRCDH